MPGRLRTASRPSRTVDRRWRRRRSRRPWLVRRRSPGRPRIGGDTPASDWGSARLGRLGHRSPFVGRAARVQLRYGGGQMGDVRHERARDGLASYPSAGVRIGHQERLRTAEPAPHPGGDGPTRLPRRDATAPARGSAVGVARPAAARHRPAAVRPARRVRPADHDRADRAGAEPGVQPAPPAWGRAGGAGWPRRSTRPGRRARRRRRTRGWQCAASSARRCRPPGHRAATAASSSQPCSAMSRSTARASGCGSRSSGPGRCCAGRRRRGGERRPVRGRCRPLSARPPGPRRRSGRDGGPRPWRRPALRRAISRPGVRRAARVGGSSSVTAPARTSAGHHVERAHRRAPRARPRAPPR